MNYVVLNEELTTDPLGRTYAPMSDLEAAVDLNTVYRTRNVTSMSATEIFQNVDTAEYNALTTDARNECWGLLGMGTLNPWGQEAQVFVEIFGIGSDTIVALQAARVEDISRGVELGLGQVHEGDVLKARAVGG
jgi:hypothetical protein